MHPTRKLRVSEAADYTGLSCSTLNKRRLTGDGPAFSKLGSVVVYEIADLDQWVAARRRTSTSDAGQSMTA